MTTNTQLPIAVLEQFRQVHGDRYSYEKSVYVKDKIKIEISCPEHGSFWQIPHAHKRGQKCPACALNERRISKEEIVTRSLEIHGGKYSYIFDDDTAGEKSGRLRVVCAEHGEFSSSLNNHFHSTNPTGCPRCGRRDATKETRQKGFETFVRMSAAAFGDRYDYSLVEYKGAHVHVDIVCPDHGVFQQTPANHRAGHHCGQCAHENRPISRGEETIEQWLVANDFSYQREKVFDDLRNPETGYRLRYDFYLPDYGVIIEFDGQHHFEPIRGDVPRLAKIQRLDAVKNEYATKNGFILHRIAHFEDLGARLACILEALSSAKG